MFQQFTCSRRECEGGRPPAQLWWRLQAAVVSSLFASSLSSFTSVIFSAAFSFSGFLLSKQHQERLRVLARFLIPCVKGPLVPEGFSFPPRVERHIRLHLAFYVRLALVSSFFDILFGIIRVCCGSS